MLCFKDLDTVAGNEIASRRRGGVEDDVVLGLCGGDLDRQRLGDGATIGILDRQGACRDGRERFLGDDFFRLAVESLHKGRFEGRFFGLRLAVDRDCRIGNDIFLSCNAGGSVGQDDLRRVALDRETARDRACIGGIGRRDLIGVDACGKLCRDGSAVDGTGLFDPLCIFNDGGNILGVFDEDGDIRVAVRCRRAVHSDFRFVKGVESDDRPEAEFRHIGEVFGTRNPELQREQAFRSASAHVFHEYVAVYDDEMPLIRRVGRLELCIVEGRQIDIPVCCSIHPDADLIVIGVGIRRKAECKIHIFPTRLGGKRHCKVRAAVDGIVAHLGFEAIQPAVLRGEFIVPHRRRVDGIFGRLCGPDADADRARFGAVIAVFCRQSTRSERREGTRHVLTSAAVEVGYEVGRPRRACIGLHLSVHRDIRSGSGTGLSRNVVRAGQYDDLRAILDGESPFERSRIGGIGGADLVTVDADGKLRRDHISVHGAGINLARCVPDDRRKVACISVYRDGDLRRFAVVDRFPHFDDGFIEGIDGNDRAEACCGQVREIAVAGRVEADREQVGRRGHLLDKRFPIHENEMPAICGVLRFVCVVVKKAVRDRTLCLEVHPDADLLIFLVGILV